MRRKKLWAFGVAFAYTLLLPVQYALAESTIKAVDENIGVVDYKADHQSSITLQVGKDNIPFDYPITYAYKDDLWEGTLQAKSITLTPANSKYETRYKMQSKEEKVKGLETVDDSEFSQWLAYQDSDGWNGILGKQNVSWIQNGYGSQKQVTDYVTGKYVRSGTGLEGTIYRNYNGNDCTLSLNSYRVVNSAQQYGYYDSDGRLDYYDKYNNSTLGWMSNNGNTFSVYGKTFRFSDPIESHGSDTWPDKYYGLDTDFSNGWEVVEYRWADSRAYNADEIASWGLSDLLVYNNGSYWWKSESGRLNKYRKGAYIKYRKAFPMNQYQGTYIGYYRPKLYDGTAVYSGTVSRQEQIATKWNATVHYEGAVESRPQITVDADGDYNYHTDTDVITAVTVKTDKDITSKEPVTATFTILGTDYQMKNIVLPHTDKQIVYVKWHTPKKPQSYLPVKIRIDGGSRLYEQTFYVNVAELEEKEPPDPTAKEDKKPSDWYLANLPHEEENVEANWYEWNHDQNGFSKSEYNVRLNAEMILAPDERVPTGTENKMGSGYGANIQVKTNLSGNAKTDSVTGAQNASCTFPEFKFKDYNRLLDVTKKGTKAVLELKKNKYSTYNNRVHFTPLWYPDGYYPVHVYVMDVWTPKGMLKANISDDIEIKGSMYDDWHIGIR